MTKYARGLAIAGLVLFCFIFAKTSMAATLAGQPVRGGGTVEIKFPVAKYFQDLAAQAGNSRSKPIALSWRSQPASTVAHLADPYRHFHKRF